ncbi:glucose-6-phosphate dehydrogenase [Candidatus Babeliales bacterium]|nr:glucose-6-phosphate dehydrogenase [Candidatus Babeliales bacterium]
MFNCTFVILGATGDLTRRKLIPAIYRLIRDKKIKNFSIIGAALPKKTKIEVLSEAKKFIKNYDSATWKILQTNFHYFQFDFHDFDRYKTLNKKLEAIEKKQKLSGNRIFYLATMPEHFSSITKNLANVGIVEKTISLPNKQSPWVRIVYEKPFGYDLKSSQKINRDISKIFKEEQIYRIDHYLGKDLVGDIALIRFTNSIFEPLWNNKHIHSVHIVLSENIGIEGRGEFYDSTGVVNDILQSHILQLLALTSMEPPKRLAGKFIRDAKSNVLKKVKLTSAVLGQYEGYKSEKGVKKDSKTETFVTAKLFINNRRWKGVPFFVKAGKCLDKKEVSIKIVFKRIKCLLDSCPSEPNYLTISIQPEEGFYLGMNSKLPGKYEVIPIRMDFCHSCLFGTNTPEAYENLLIDVMRGDQSVFLRRDEIEQSWKIVEQLKSKKLKVHKYKKGTNGPEVKL